MLLSAKNMAVAVPDSLLTWRKQGMDVWAVNAALSAKHSPTDFFLPCIKTGAAAVSLEKGGLTAAELSRKVSRAAAAPPTLRDVSCAQPGTRLMHSYKRTTQSSAPPPQRAQFFGLLSYEPLLPPEQGQCWWCRPLPLHHSPGRLQLAGSLLLGFLKPSADP